MRFLKLSCSSFSQARRSFLLKPLARLPFYNSLRSEALYKSTQSSGAFSQSSDTFLSGYSAEYLNNLYEAYLSDPSSVEPSLKEFFHSTLPKLTQDFAQQSPSQSSSAYAQPSSDSSNSTLDDHPSTAGITEHLKVQQLIRAYQVRGHQRAKIDPLSIIEADVDFSPAPELGLEFYGLSESSLQKNFILSDTMFPHFITDSVKTLKLSSIISLLEKIYCSGIGFEYSHILDRVKCNWIRSKIEVPLQYTYSKSQKKTFLESLIWADSFERFLDSKYPGEKRFGLDGCETLIPCMKAIIEASSQSGVTNVVLGMAHRGRLNVLSNVVNKPNKSIFFEFNGEVDPDLLGSGDVKYHLGMYHKHETASGNPVTIYLLANPSHLEAVNPVVQGKSRALQFYLNDPEGEKVLPILVHGDAAFAGQGVVYESLGFSQLPCYRTGGLIHIVINNQIGFTTDPRVSRSTLYCTDVAKTYNAPILHVNADNVEDVIFAAEFASQWRQTYKSDVVIDLVCYRRFGHNEFDEPSFTQPKMYQRISKKTRVVDMYISKLLADNVFTESEIQELQNKIWSSLEKSHKDSKTYKPRHQEWCSENWGELKNLKELSFSPSKFFSTGISEEVFKSVGQTISSYPQGFNIHKGLVKTFEARKKMIGTQSGIDMTTAEALAFGSLLLEGTHVRLSGQDVERGTFSQRHCVLHDQVNEEKYIPLAHLSSDNNNTSNSHIARFVVCNSSLSEFGVLGFELGYSLVSPRSLVIWEAQFGDFCNNAQCIIDQFIVSGERKWMQKTAITMLLPHGYDGNGPEHSSGRMERFLQLCDDDPNTFTGFNQENCRQIQDCNIQVVYPSTPANYFHVLRRQIHREFRKPLVVFTSKALLRHPLAKSSFEEFKSETIFAKLYPEAHGQTLVSNQDITKMIFCSGQIYYSLIKARETQGVNDAVIIRIEQISPFPFDLVIQEFEKYPSLQAVSWVQEEPQNMGAWSYVQPRLKTCLRAFYGSSNGSSITNKIIEVDVVSREPSAAVATGLKKIHRNEENAILESVFGTRATTTSSKNGNSDNSNKHDNSIQNTTDNSSTSTSSTDNISAD